MTRLQFVIALAALAALPAPASTARAQPAGDAQNPSFNLVNRSTSIINEVYATPAGVTTWGQDRLGNVTIAPGASAPIRLPADGNCVYDVQVKYANGEKAERRGLNTCTMDSVVFPVNGATTPPPTTPPAQGATNDPTFRLINRGRSPVNEVYATVTGDRSWGDDRLGDDTVAVGGNRVIRLPRGACLYDVRVVYANGQSTEKRRINLCAIDNLTVP